MRFILFLLSFILIHSSTIAQLTNSTESKKVEALNNYVFFANECAHGMLIVHGLLYRFNQDLNKKIDMDSYQVNFYSNKDLPADIFDNTWFYDIAPYDWHKMAEIMSSVLPAASARELNLHADQLKIIVVDINSLRFSLEKLIAADMNNQDNVLAVYNELERATTLFNDFHTQQQKLRLGIDKVYYKIKSSLDIEFPNLISTMDNAYRASLAIMNTLHAKTDGGLSEKIEKLNTAQANLKATSLESYNSTRLLSREVKDHYKNLRSQAEKFSQGTNDFYYTADVPAEYKMYGKYYYYYNKDLISKFNRFGPGIVFEINSILDYLRSDQLRYMEVPHFYQVVYPKKIEKVDHLSSTTGTLTALPTKLKNREVLVASKSIKVDSNKVVFELYDHMIEDGDIVSINFNGDWVIENRKITTKPYELKVQLNPEGKNYIILHAENVGHRPPNTMAVSYMYNGKRKQIVMKADLNTSEMIEILQVNK